MITLHLNVKYTEESEVILEIENLADAPHEVTRQIEDIFKRGGLNGRPKLEWSDKSGDVRVICPNVHSDGPNPDYIPVITWLNKNWKPDITADDLKRECKTQDKAKRLANPTIIAWSWSAFFTGIRGPSMIQKAIVKAAENTIASITGKRESLAWGLSRNLSVHMLTQPDITQYILAITKANLGKVREESLIEKVLSLYRTVEHCRDKLFFVTSPETEYALETVLVDENLLYLETFMDVYKKKMNEALAKAKSPEATE